MIVANRLTDGRVVFLAAGARWVESIDEGLVIESETSRIDSLERAERAVAAGLVINPYLIDVAVEDGRLRPRELREMIRAFGPTVSDAPVR